MSSGKGDVGIPVNVVGSSYVNIGIQGGAVNVPQKVPNNNNNADTNNRPTMSPIMINNQNTSNSSPKNSNMAKNIHTNNNNNNNTNATTNSINNTNNMDVNTVTNKSLSPAEIQQRQKLLLQQRALQQQQAMQNFENQFFQLLMTLNKKPKRIYNFVEETDLILQKYEQYRPSFELHIYEDIFKICAPSNSRFQQQQQVDSNQINSPNVNNKNNNNQRTSTVHNDGLILEKDDQTLKEFLEYVARGRIPEAIMEVLRDSNIQFYESNLILQVYDHTNTVEVTISRPVNKDSMNNLLPNNIQGDVSNTQGQNQQALNKQIRKFRRPRVYRTLLRPNDLTNYYDMMTYADQARFSDSIYQQFESEILSLTKRNIKLDVDLNPFEHREKIDEDEFCEPKFNENTKAMEFVHKKESTEDGTKGKVGHIPEHEETPQSISNYEQLMLIMSERTSTITKSTLATSLAEVSKKQNSNITSNNNNGLETSRNSSISLNSIPGSSSGGFKSSGLTTTANSANLTNLTTALVLSKTKSTATSSSEKSNNENTRFSRLKFIEQWKINVEKRKQQMVLSNNDNNANGLPDYLVLGTPFMTKISMTVPMTPQAQLLQQQKQFQKFQQQQQQQQQPIQTKEKKTTGKGIKHGASGATEKPKAKRTKKTKKDTDGAQQTPKRKRVSKKKQVAADSNNITAASPKSQPASTIGTPI
ncbi:Spt20p PWA37_002974 [Arxiozyma heterogenica]|uniref:Spt20p n=1 Tax=Arxiozyma heterogenica TaxID=278026 RepID=UPI002EF60EA9